MTVLIVGTSVAGLTMALSLHQIGIDLQVFESVDAIQPLGVGINLLPHVGREQRAPQGVGKIEDVLNMEEPEGTAAAFLQIAGFDKDARNSRPPIVAVR